MVKMFDPDVAKAHHGVLRSLQVDIEAISRTFKAQLPYVGLLRLEGHRVLSAVEITDIEVSGRKVGQVCVPKIRPDQSRPSRSCHQSFRLTEQRFCKRS